MVKRNRDFGFGDLGMERDFNLVMGNRARRRHGGKVSAEDKESRGRYVFPEEIEKAKEGYKKARESGNKLQARQIAKIVQKKAKKYETQQTRIAAGETMQKERLAALKEKSYEKQRAKQAGYLAEKLRYESSRTGKAGAAISKFIGRAQTKHGFTRALYQRQGLIAPTTRVIDPLTGNAIKGEVGYGKGRAVIGVRTGQRGRPVGSYDSRYAAVGGIYEFRKQQAHLRRLERLQALKDAAINPRQQEVLRQLQARDEARRQNPEAQTIPSTNGKIDTGSYNNEIDAATHAFE